MRLRKIPIGAVVCSAALAWLSGGTVAYAADGDKAGIAAAVRGTVQQVLFTAPSRIGRNVATGDAIHLGDRIVTDNTAGLQIMLQDQTTFTIGPNSSLTIDEFVYNPASHSGKLTASIARGTFRFVSGKIAENNPDGMTVKLPVASIGVRGTTAIGDTDGNSARVALVGQGDHNNVGRPPSRLIITAGSVVQVIYRAGFFVQIERTAPPATPTRTPPAMLQQWSELLAGLRAGDGRLIDRSRQEADRGEVDRRRVLVATGQAVAQALGPQARQSLLQRVADEHDRRVRDGNQLQLPHGVFLFASPVIPMSGTLSATYQFKYVLDFNAHRGYGDVEINTAGAFTPGTGNFQLLKDPFVERKLELREVGNVPGLPGNVLVDYRFTRDGIAHRVIYREGMSSTAAGQGLTPGVRIK